MSNMAENLADATHDAADRTDEVIRRKASQLQKFFDDVEDLLRQVSKMEDSEVSRLRGRVESSMNRVKDAARDGAQAAITSTREAARATDEYVHRKPWVAIGASAVAGLMLGALLRGK